MGTEIEQMPEQSSTIPQKLRLVAAIVIVIGVGLCALALVAQAMQPDEIGFLVLSTVFA